MATILTTKELRTMSVADLRRECDDHRLHVAKMKLGIELNKEKDTAKYRREKRLLARMETIITEKRRMPTEPLKKASKKPTLSAQ